MPDGDPGHARAKWFELVWRYEASDEFNRQLVTTFFSPGFRATDASAISKRSALAREHKRLLDDERRQQEEAARADEETPVPPQLYVGGAILFVLLVLSRLAYFRRGGRPF